jgi:hypothetical protein
MDNMHTMRSEAGLITVVSLQFEATDAGRVALA